MTSSPTQRHADRWAALCECLLRLPDADTDEAAWLAEAAPALLDVTDARALVWVLPAAKGDLLRAVARADSHTVQIDLLDGSPRGWIGALLTEAGPARPEGAGALGQLLGDADPLWDGEAWSGDTPIDYVRLDRSVTAQGALLAVEPLGTGLDPVVSLIEHTLANRVRVRRLAAQVITDELTGAYNYRYLGQALRREIHRAARFQHPLSVLMLDVDHLKAYNERFGHLHGSRVLKLLAEELLAGTRDIDILAKYGGDEFLLILPHTDKAGAQVVADRMRRRVAARAFPPLECGAMTCSVGVATFPDDADRAETLIGAADQALFEAKRRGRNQVVAA
jgi:diguanylate cyclase (GGDEF)-like protein